MPDPAPLTPRTLSALARAATRELLWGLRAVANEVRCWREIAERIPNQVIRDAALSALRNKRPHIDGAALFSTLPRRRSRNLLRGLVAYEIIWDFLDSINERSADAGQANGQQLHLALIDALDPRRPICDYYRYSPWSDDGGYLWALVAVCRECLAELPSFESVREVLVAEATRGQVCAINHDPDPVRRDAGLQAWAASEFPEGHEASWFELTAAASTDLTIFALLALASEPAFEEGQISSIREAYFPWASGLAALLDSYVNQDEDIANADHSYIAHYASPELASEGVCRMIRRCLQETRALERSETHGVIVACMFAMYLSKHSALTPAMREGTKRIVRAGGSLTRVLHPILRLWRAAYSLRSA